MPRSVHSDSYRNLIAALVKLRREAGVTQVDLADRLARPQSYVSKYEQRERRLDVIEYLEAAEALGTDPIRLLGELRRQGAI